MKFNTGNILLDQSTQFDNLKHNQGDRGKR